MSAWALLACMIPLAVLSQFYRSATGVIAPELVADLRLSTEEIGLVSGAFFISITALQLPVGILLDRWGARRVIVALLGLAVFGSIVFAAASGFGGLVLGRVLIAAGFAAVTIGSVVILKIWLPPRELAAAIAVLFAAANTGSLVATAPLAAASVWIGWRQTFLVLAALTAICGAIFYAFVRDRAAADGKPSQREPLRASLTGVLDVMRIPDIRLILPLITVGYASSIAIVGLWGGPYLHEVHGLDTIARGNMLSIAAIALIAGTLVYGPLEKRFPNRRLIVTLGTGATAAPLLVLAAWPAIQVDVATVLLSLFAFFSGFSVVVMAHAMSLLPQHLAGRGATTLNIALLGGAAIIQSLTGWGLEAAARGFGVSPAYGALFGSLAVVLLAALVCYRRIEMPRPEAEAVSASN